MVRGVSLAPVSQKVRIGGFAMKKLVFTVLMLAVTSTAYARGPYLGFGIGIGRFFPVYNADVPYYGPFGMGRQYYTRPAPARVVEGNYFGAPGTFLNPISGTIGTIDGSAPAPTPLTIINPYALEK
jgi:hypothetical protein